MSNFHLLAVVVVVILLAPLFFSFKRSGTKENFEIPPIMSLPVLPEYENATPVDLVKLYKDQAAKLPEDLRSLNLPVSVLSDPKSYPSIISALKRRNLLPA